MVSGCDGEGRERKIRERERDVPVCTSHLLYRVCMNVPEVKALALYFQDTCINGPFPVPMWKVSDAIINRVEGWHHNMNRTMGFHHPNVFQLVKC